MKDKISLSRRKPQNPPSSRLPEDWNPSEEIWQKAKSKFGVNDDTLRWETVKFRDYWHAKSHDATKANWDAAWRNWMQKAAEGSKSNGFGRHATGPPSSPMRGKGSQYADIFQRLADEERKKGGAADSQDETPEGQGRAQPNYGSAKGIKR